MLAIGRRPGESILIGDDIRVKVTQVKRGGKVVIAIDAPDHVDVVREEVWEEDREPRKPRRRRPA